MNLLFFDIDGTLLTEGQNRYIPQSTMQGIRHLQARGHKCFINTGRAKAELTDEMLHLGFDGIICGCGTYIEYQQKPLFHHEISRELSDAILSSLENCRLEWVLEGTHDIYYSTVPYTTHIGDFYREFHQLFPDAVCDVDPSVRGLTFDKFCICLTPESDFSSFHLKFTKELDFIDRGSDFYEIVPRGFSKATGMQFLMDHFGVSRENTYAFGDSSNDLPMLEFAGHSIAMQHSDQVVLDMADYVTVAVERDGIYKALTHFNLI